MKAPVAVLGATGQVGLFAIEALLKAGHAVIAVTREAPASPQTTIDGLRRCDMTGLTTRADTLSQGQPHRLALLSCGPVTLAHELLEAGPASGFGSWERAVVVGTTSLISKSASPDANERDEIAVIDHALDSIRARCRERSIPLTVLHPTLIYGCGMDENLTRVWRFIRRAGFAPVAGSAAGRRQPLHVADLAGTIVRALGADPPMHLETAVCGGSAVTYKEMIAGLFEAAGRPVRLLPLPGFAVPLASGLSGLVPGAGRVSTQMLRRQSRDLVFDDSKAREALQHTPRPFRPNESDFRLPPQVDRVRQALQDE